MKNEYFLTQGTFRALKKCKEEISSGKELEKELRQEVHELKSLLTERVKELENDIRQEFKDLKSLLAVQRPQDPHYSAGGFRFP